MESSWHTTAFSQSVVEYIPDVPEDKKPFVGMPFEDLEAAYAFYNAYAKLAGFSVRKASMKINKETKLVKSRVYTCNKQGFETKPMHDINNERHRNSTRTGCHAMLGIAKPKTSELFKVYRFEEVHNHICVTPSKVHRLKSHRKLSCAKKKLFSTLQSVNVSIPQAMGLFTAESMGVGDVGFVETDLRNYVRDENVKVKGQDAQLFVEHFILEKEHNPSFFYKVKTNGEKKIELAFWAVPTSRRSFHFFGDVVTLDSTYNTNRYGFPFIPFVGVNHHFQTVMFGCAFLFTESFESYEWVLKAFLEAMPGPPPKMMITDQDPALDKAINSVLPQAYHRYCIWHILNKIPEKVGGPVNGDPNFRAIFYIIKYSENPEEFETRWQILIQEHGLEDNGWLSYMFEVRDQWVPAYFKNTFSAGMSSTQRSEGNHSFLKKYVYKGCGINEFVTRFDRALSRQREKENTADHEDINGRPKLHYGTEFEIQVAKTYTLSMFHEFQKELHSCFTYSVEPSIVDHDQVVFSLTYRGQSTDLWVKKSRSVCFNNETKIATCSCLKFEFEGIPCAHILRVLDTMKIYELPKHYILDRWKIGARRGIVTDRDGSEIKEDKRRALSGGNGKALDVFLGGYYDLVSESVEDQEYGLALFEEWRLKFKEHLSNKTSNESMTTKASAGSCTVEYVEPDYARHKGCGKRLKSTLEKGSLNRMCRVCKGHGHDKRNCPKQANGHNQVT